MFCPKCGTSLKDNAAFCISCGEKIEKIKRFCRICGSNVDLETKCCIKCGESVDHLDKLYSNQKQLIKAYIKQVEQEEQQLYDRKLDILDPPPKDSFEYYAGE